MIALITSCTNLRISLKPEIVQRFVLVACAALLFVPYYLKSRTSQDLPVSAAFSSLSGVRLLVKVGGDVRHAGVYDVDVNMLAVSVIDMAGPLHPLKPLADRSVNQQLTHGSSVMLSVSPDGSPLIISGKMSVPERLVLNIPLDFPTMSAADFDRLPGVGPALAKRIIEYRQNNGGIMRVEDLLSVDGIGEKKYKIIRGYLQVTENTK